MSQPTEEQAFDQFYNQSFDDLAAAANQSGVDIDPGNISYEAYDIAARRVAAWQAGVDIRLRDLVLDAIARHMTP
jgi:hypothetical protein